MKRLMTLLALACSVSLLMTACSKTRQVEDNLSPAFAEASDTVKAEIGKASAAIDQRSFKEALTAIKAVVDAGDLTDEQVEALEMAVTDITVIVSENPPENEDEANEIFDLIADIQDAMLQ